MLTVVIGYPEYVTVCQPLNDHPQTRLLPHPKLLPLTTKINPTLDPCTLSIQPTPRSLMYRYVCCLIFLAPAPHEGPLSPAHINTFIHGMLGVACNQHPCHHRIRILNTLRLDSTTASFKHLIQSMQLIQLKAVILRPSTTEQVSERIQPTIPIILPKVRLELGSLQTLQRKLRPPPQVSQWHERIRRLHQVHFKFLLFGMILMFLQDEAISQHNPELIISHHPLLTHQLPFLKLVPQMCPKAGDTKLREGIITPLDWP